MKTNEQSTVIKPPSGKDRALGDQCPNEKSSPWRTALAILKYTPKRCRYDPNKPPEFSMFLNLLFGFAAAFTVANLYYNHPILNILANDFHISNEKASLVPTLAQAGYAGGLLFLCPLGDSFPRRPFVLLLIWFTGTAWIGLCVTKSFPAFLFISFLTSLTTVTPQLMLPLVGDLAPPNRRATAISIVVSGLLLGILIARVLSGVVTNFVSWRVIYWVAFGLQYLILLLLWLFLPDYPSTNPGKIGLTDYFRMLISVFKMLFKHPILVQSCLIGLCTATTFTSYWTTLTFLLSGPLYNYAPLTIGLFALIGVFAMSFGPPFARLVIDRLPTTLYSVIIGESLCLTGIIAGTFAGTRSVAGPIVQAFLLDMGIQTTQIANRTAIYDIEPKGRNRVNTAFMLSVFVGQLVGTAVGNRLYALGNERNGEGGGWIASGSCSIGFVVIALLLCLSRGPNEEGWIGWRGGWPRVERATEGEGSGEEQSEGNTAEREKSSDEKRVSDEETGTSI